MVADPMGLVERGQPGRLVLGSGVRRVVAEAVGTRRRSGSSRSPRSPPGRGRWRRACAAGSSTSSPRGVSSSQQISLSAWSHTPGTPKLATWRVAGPAPRISTGTSSAGAVRRRQRHLAARRRQRHLGARLRRQREDAVSTDVAEVGHPAEDRVATLQLELLPADRHVHRARQRQHEQLRVAGTHRLRLPGRQPENPQPGPPPPRAPGRDVDDDRAVGAQDGPASRLLLACGPQHRGGRLDRGVHLAVRRVEQRPAHDQPAHGRLGQRTAPRREVLGRVGVGTPPSTTHGSVVVAKTASGSSHDGIFSQV